MQGARKYAMMFKTGQHGRLFFVSGEHARGKTFQIWVLPMGVVVEDGMPWKVTGAVEVYGITGGQPGWTETYGWLHEGKWQSDFYNIVEERKAQIEQKAKEDAYAELIKIESEKERIKSLLSTY